MLRCNIFLPMVLLLVVIAWLYVALMMAVAEATHSNGTLLGALFTFVLYGVGPVALVVWFGLRPARRRLYEQTEAAARSGEPDAGGQPPADPVPPVRKEP